MAQKRRRFTTEFKKRVALEALREQDTVQRIAERQRGAPEPGERMEAASGGGAVRGVRGRWQARRGP